MATQEAKSSVSAVEAPKIKKRIGVVQFTSTADLPSNFKRAMSFVREAAENKSDIVAFPENMLYLGGSITPAEALSMDSQPVVAFRDLAKELHISILLGSFPEKVEEDKTKVHNTSIYINNTGDIKAIYRKIHLFDLTLPTVTLTESEKVKAGKDVVVYHDDQHQLTLGLTVCYDLRFPALYQKLREEKAQIIFVPSAFTIPTGMAHWITLLQARAIETQCYIVAPAQIGKHNEKRASFGSSVLIDPWGTIIARAPEKECIIYGDIDIEYLDKIRREMPVFSHRVPHIDFHPST